MAGANSIATAACDHPEVNEAEAKPASVATDSNAGRHGKSSFVAGS